MVVVTGASGFVGGHIVRLLGERARPVLRSDVGPWTAANLRRVFEGATAVVHAASVMHKPSTPPEEYTRFNVEGTQAVVEAARAVGVERLVFTSSIKLYGEHPVGVIDEDMPLGAEAHYARTKAESERIVMEAQDLKPIALRLCPVFGRGDKGNVRTMIRAIRRRRFFVPGDGSTRKSIIHVSTVADAVRVALFEKPEVVGMFVLADAVTPTVRELSDTIARALGRRPPLSVPSRLLRLTADGVGRLARKVGVKTAISGSLVEKAMQNSLCDPSRVERALAIRCHVDLDWAIRDEIAWLESIGEL